MTQNILFKREITSSLLIKVVWRKKKIDRNVFRVTLKSLERVDNMCDFKFEETIINYYWNLC